MKIPHTASARRLLFMLVISSSSFAGGDGFPASGAEVINNNCSRCHNARPVQEFSLEDWSVIMPHMRERAHLTGEETRAVMDYFRTLSRRPPVAATPVPSKTASGKELMVRYGCLGCHSLGGQGGSAGPALDGVVQRRGADFVKKKLANPQFDNPQSTMPRAPLSGAEIQAIVDYLARK